MALMRRALARLLLPRLASGALPTSVARIVHGAVRADPELTAAYDALRRIEGADKDPHAPLSAGQLDLVEALVLDAAGTTPPDAVRARRFTALLAGSGVAAVAAALVLVVVVPRFGRDADDALAVDPIHVGALKARGDKIAAAPLGVKVTCLSADGAHIVGAATAGARQSGARLDCTAGGLLAFSTTNLAREPRHVFVVGVGADGGRRYYAPFDANAASVAVAPGVTDAPLGSVADTASMPRERDVALFVLVSDEAFTAASIERQLARAQDRGLALQSAERLPLDVPVQARIDMHLQEPAAK